MARSGNNHRGGRPRGSKASHTLQAERGKALLVEMYMKEAAPINEALLKKAKEGDVGAAKELHDRVYGKAIAPIELSGGLDLKVSKLEEIQKATKDILGNG